MWECYFALCEVGFRYQILMVFQLQLAKKQKALPLTRDYIYDAEREMRQRDGQYAPARRRRRAS
jgi:cyclopropane-fatty-acyl-phospholipid synthase